MAFPNSRGCELESRVEQLDDELEIAEKRIERLINQVAKLEKRLNLFNHGRTIRWLNQGDI
jgi:predicted RNase H-like nuclease (RuvC/YqgF family)